MANNRSSSSLKNSLTAKLLPRIPSPYSITLYIILLFAFSIFIFIFYSKDILEDEQNPLLSGGSQLKQDLDSGRTIGNAKESEGLYLLKSDNQLGKQSRSAHCGESFLQIPDEQLWGAPFRHGLRQCVKPTTKYKDVQGGNYYITVRSNGGLNQMRTGISDMVAVARLMNATLVIPQLDKRSFWQDTSTFSDIFDELHFITTLQGDVRIVKELPKELESVPRARKHFTSWSGMGYYEEMTQLWKDYQVIHVVKSDSRLANNDLPLDIQRLRCRALYHALRFSPPIENLGKKLVERLKLRAGRYIALHLRYEKDMLSFTGCTYGLTDSESEELRVMRENTNHWKIKKINSAEQRTGGFCPLTPKEVGIFLQALGYPSSTLIYVAAGEIYGGSTHLSELTSRFPNVVSKETIATQEELKQFGNHASQTAALDYIISIESDVFIPSYSGNMARAVEGHRRFLGHRKTITPDRRGLVEIFDKLESGQLREESSLSYLVMQLHRNRQGAPRKRESAPPGIKGRARFRTEESFYQNPYPECICGTKITLR